MGHAGDRKSQPNPKSCMTYPASQENLNAQVYVEYVCIYTKRQRSQTVTLQLMVWQLKDIETGIMEKILVWKRDYQLNFSQQIRQTSVRPSAFGQNNLPLIQ